VLGVEGRDRYLEWAGEDDLEEGKPGIEDDRGRKTSMTSLPSKNVGGLCSMRLSATCQGPLPAPRVERELEKDEVEEGEKKVSDHMRPRAINSTLTNPATRIRFCQRRIWIDALKAASPSTSQTSMSSADVEPRMRASALARLFINGSSPLRSFPNKT
jgi:hypothetical protein